MKAQSPKFIASGTRSEHLPTTGYEVAFAGRSNVGKSSLVCSLLGRQKIARTSKTPGRTQTLNLFETGLGWMLVDLPGHGYAKLSKKQRAELADMLSLYITDRPNLSGVVLIVDARRSKPSPEDVEMIDLVEANSQRLGVVVNKIDLTPKNQRDKVMSQWRKALPMADFWIPYSTVTNEGKTPLAKAVYGWVKG